MQVQCNFNLKLLYSRAIIDFKGVMLFLKRRVSHEESHDETDRKEKGLALSLESMKDTVTSIVISQD